MGLKGTDITYLEFYFNKTVITINSVILKVYVEIFCSEGVAAYEEHIKDLSIDVLLLAELKSARRKMEVRIMSSVRE